MTTPINKILINQIQNLSNEELAIVSASLSAILGQGGGGGGEPCASAWRPTVTDEGMLSWTLSTSTTTPTPVNIMGPSGTSGAKGDDGTSIVLQSVTDVEGGKQVTLAWGETPSTSSFVIPSGTPGTDGQNGENGTSVIVKSIREFNDTVGSHTKGGTEVTLEWTEDDTVKTSAFSAFNGEKGQDGAGASYAFDDITLSGTGGTDDPIGVDTGYIASQTWVGQQGFLKNSDLTDYATKTYANDASANALSEAKTWVNQQNFATSAGLDDNKQYAMTTNGWTDFTIPSTSGYLPLSGGTVSGKTTISGGAFDTFELKRSGQTSTGNIGINGAGGMSLKISNANDNTQLNVAPNADMDKRFSIGNVYDPTAYLIPAKIEQAGWSPSANDKILHIVLES